MCKTSSIYVMVLWAVMHVSQCVVRLSRSINDVNMYERDSIVLSLDEYLEGDGEEASVSVDNPLLSIEEQFDHSVDLITDSCLQRYVYSGKQYIFSVCGVDGENSLNRITNDTRESITLHDASGQDCIQMAHNIQTDILMLVCVSSNTRKMTVVTIDPSSFSISDTHSITLTEDETSGNNNLVLLPFEEDMIIKYAQKTKSFRLVSVVKDKIVDRGLFTIDDNIIGEYNSKEACSLTGVKVHFGFVYLSLYCSKNRIEYYMECVVDKEKLDCPQSKTVRDQGLHTSDQQIYLLREETPLRRKSTSQLFLFKENRLFMVDFKTKVLKDIFKFDDLYFYNEETKKRLLEIRGIVLTQKFLYLSVKELGTNTDIVYTASIYKNYYRTFTLSGNPKSKISFVLDMDTRSRVRNIVQFYGEEAKIFKRNLFFGLKIEAPVTSPGNRSGVH